MRGWWAGIDKKVRGVNIVDATYALARNLVTVNYESLPHEVVEATKKQVLDMLGVALGGSAKPGVKELQELVVEWGGKEESTILCYGNKVPAPNAALDITVPIT